MTWILVTSSLRAKPVRINCIGILDVLEADSKKTIGKLQEEDMFAIGRLLALATGNTMAFKICKDRFHRVQVF